MLTNTPVQNMSFQLELNKKLSKRPSNYGLTHFYKRCVSAKHWYIPLVEVNQAIIAWSFRQFLSLLEEKGYVLD